MRVEAAVEADHQLRAGRLHHLQAGLHPGDVEIDRLLAEDRLPLAGEHLDQVGMGVGRGADHHRVHVRRLRDRLDGAHLGAVLPGQPVGRLRHGVGDRHQPRLPVAGHRPRMHLADAPGAQKAETNCHASFLVYSG